MAKVEGPVGASETGMVYKAVEGFKNLVGKVFLRSVSQEQGSEPQVAGRSEDFESSYILKQIEQTRQMQDQLWRSTPEGQGAALATHEAKTKIADSKRPESLMSDIRLAANAAADHRQKVREGRVVHEGKFNQVMNDVSSREASSSSANLEALGAFDSGSSDSTYTAALMDQYVYRNPQFVELDKEIGALNDVLTRVETLNKEFAAVNQQLAACEKELKFLGKMKRRPSGANRPELAASYQNAKDEKEQLLEELNSLPQKQALDRERAVLTDRFNALVIDLLQQAAENTKHVNPDRVEMFNDIEMHSAEIDRLKEELDLENDGQGFRGTSSELKAGHRKMMEHHKKLTALTTGSSAKRYRSLLGLLNQFKSDSAQAKHNAPESFLGTLQEKLAEAAAKRNTPEAQQRIMDKLDMLEARKDWTVNAEKLSYLESKLGDLSVQFTDMRMTMKGHLRNFVRLAKRGKVIAAQTAFAKVVVSYFRQKKLAKRVTKCTELVVSLRSVLNVTGGMVDVGKDGVSVSSDVANQYRKGNKPRPYFTRTTPDEGVSWSLDSPEESAYKADLKAASTKLKDALDKQTDDLYGENNVTPRNNRRRQDRAFGYMSSSEVEPGFDDSFVPYPKANSNSEDDDSAPYQSQLGGSILDDEDMKRVLKKDNDTED